MPDPVVDPTVDPTLDPTTGKPVVTTINPGEEHWSTTIVGDNAERAEAMKAFETPEKFFEANDTALDWRRGIAGDDDKYYAELQRFNAALDYGNSFREAQQTIRSGNLKAALKDDATEDDVKAYREENGIPLEPSGYLENLPEGLVLGENDKEIFEDYLLAIHGHNAPPEIAHATLEWYNGFAEQQQAIQLALDDDHSAETTTELRGAWGADYQANLNLVHGLLEGQFGKDAKEQLLNGRYADGRAFLNDPKVLKGFAEMARALNPIHQITPPGHDPSQTLNDEISELEKFMSEHRTEYNKDVGKQERLRQLYQIRIDQAAAA
jgi:hypothetical protein